MNSRSNLREIIPIIKSLILAAFMLGLIFACGKGTQSTNEEEATSEVSSLTSDAAGADGIQLLLWSKKYNGGRCYYYKEHTESISPEHRINTSVTLLKFAIPKADLLRTVSDRIERYRGDLFRGMAPWSTCSGKDGFSFLDCLKLYPGMRYQKDKFKSIVMAKDSIERDLTDVFSIPDKDAKFMRGPASYSDRIKELELRELVDILSKFPENPAAGECPKSSKIFKN